jgi:hypothetical protein
VMPDGLMLEEIDSWILIKCGPMASFRRLILCTELCVIKHIEPTLWRPCLWCETSPVTQSPDWHWMHLPWHSILLIFSPQQTFGGESN